MTPFFLDPLDPSPCRKVVFCLRETLTFAKKHQKRQVLHTSDKSNEVLHAREEIYHNKKTICLLKARKPMLFKIRTVVERKIPPEGLRCPSSTEVASRPKTQIYENYRKPTFCFLQKTLLFSTT